MVAEEIVTKIVHSIIQCPKNEPSRQTRSRWVTDLNSIRTPYLKHHTKFQVDVTYGCCEKCDLDTGYGQTEGVKDGRTEVNQYTHIFFETGL